METATRPEFKFYPVKAGDVVVKDNTFSGIAAMMGNLDEGNDVIAQGSFKDAIDGFLRAGFVPEGHDWYSKPVAMPKAAHEDGNKLVVEAEFHSTPSAQEARTIMTERLKNGLDVGLSIGFDIAPDGAKMFKSGEDLLEHLGKHDFETKDFDAPGIKACSGPCRLITKIKRLFEFSIVSVPMNPLAVATAVKVMATDDFKSFEKISDFEDFLHDAGFSRKAGKQFVSAFKGILLPRDAGGDVPDPDTTDDVPAETVEAKTETEPESDTPAIVVPPLLFGRDGRIYPYVTSH